MDIIKLTLHRKGMVKMLLSDVFGFVKRNVKKMSRSDKEKAYKEMKNIVNMLERELKIN